MTLPPAGIPPRYHGAADIDPHPQAAPFIEGEATAIAFQGPVGRGKTWAATRTLLAWHDAHPKPYLAPPHGSPRCPVLWVDATEAAQQIAGEWGQYPRPYLELLRGVPCLLVDDLGAESRAEAIQAELGGVLRHRYNHERATIVTTQSLDLLEARIASRWSGLVVGIKGPDLRKGAKL